MEIGNWRVRFCNAVMFCIFEKIKLSKNLNTFHGFMDLFLVSVNSGYPIIHIYWRISTNFWKMFLARIQNTNYMQISSQFPKYQIRLIMSTSYRKRKIRNIFFFFLFGVFFLKCLFLIQDYKFLFKFLLLIAKHQLLNVNSFFVACKYA